MSANIKLEVVKGPMRAKKFLFEEHDTFVFGRELDCHACLPEDSCVSRHHFLLEVNPPDACIRDLGSMNGTYVNGRKIGGRKKGETPEQGARQQYPEIHLNGGDEIKVGETILMLRVHAPAFCCQCGSEIAEAEKEKWALAANSSLCGSCREKQVHKAKRMSLARSAKGKAVTMCAQNAGQRRRTIRGGRFKACWTRRGSNATAIRHPQLRDTKLSANSVLAAMEPSIWQGGRKTAC
jgi:hypothetical protein